MEIPKLLEDLNIISKLGDNPGTDDGLDADSLKAKFDAAALIIQTFINNVLIPAINPVVSPESGLSMKADIEMGGHMVTGLGAPTGNNDAVRKKYVDDNFSDKDHDHDEAYTPKNIGALATDGSNAMAAAFNAGGFRVTNVAAPTSNNDAVPKAYVDNGFAKKDSLGSYLNSVVTYYNSATNMSADDLLVPTALIPVNTTVNRELYDIVGGGFAHVITLFYPSVTNASRKVQIGFTENSAPAKMAVRVYGSNGWTAWKYPGFDENETYHALFRNIGGVEQYLNPVMALGTEYCTLERYKGKPVYTKLVNLGTLPSSTTKTVAHGLSGVTVVRYQAFASNGSYVQEFPFHNTAGTIVGKVYYSPDGVKVITYDDLSAYTGVIQLWYTK